MLKSYEAIYDNGQLNWLGKIPAINKAKVIVVIEENTVEEPTRQSIKELKGIAPKPQRVISLEEMDNAIQLEGAKL
jgi:predicted DNA-binding antitoxin AbrB/MazE fold protein